MRGEFMRKFWVYQKEGGKMTMREFAEELKQKKGENNDNNNLAAP